MKSFAEMIESNNVPHELMEGVEAVQDRVEACITSRPAISLGLALIGGLFVGWVLKR